MRPSSEPARSLGQTRDRDNNNNNIDGSYVYPSPYYILNIKKRAFLNNPNLSRLLRIFI